MILDIDTADRQKINLTFFNKNTERCFEFETDDQSADLLVAIEGILKKEKLTLKDLKAILVNIGPGSFTGTRVGVTVANTLAWTLNIPVCGYQADKQDKILNQASQNKHFKFFKSALPYYPLEK